MQLNIVSPTEKKTIEIEWIDLSTTIGSFIILPEHAPVIFRLSPESLAIFSLGEDKQETLIIKTGIAHVTRESVTLLLND